MVIVTISKVAHNQHLLNQRQIRALWEICRVNKGTRLRHRRQVSSLLTLKRFHTSRWCFRCIFHFHQVNVGQGKIST